MEIIESFTWNCWVYPAEFFNVFSNQFIVVSIEEIIRTELIIRFTVRIIMITLIIFCRIKIL